MRLPPASILLVLPLLSLTPSIAHACGGTFCDGVTQMSVDQTGEDILFIREADEIEVHVRIAYEGEADRFAWLVPLQAVPDISVGSELLFAELSQKTAPVWLMSRTYACEADDPNCCSLTFIPESDVAPEPGPDVVLQATVGAYEVVVLQGGTAGEIIDFLQANDYQQDPEAEPIVQAYVDEGYLFAAAKLRSGVGVESIHPLVLRMQADEFCVPIRLTRIAAQQDMGIRAYFLGTERAVPSNYAHVVLNPLRYDWRSGPWLERYVELLTLAVDEAGGKAFATDYAGSAELLNGTNVFSDDWDEVPFATSMPITALDLIAEQGLNTHPLIQPLLMQFIPPPDGVDPQEFWNEIWAYADLIDYTAWDGPAFAAAIAEQIIEPGLHAADLIETWPYLTRLHTTMSPVEMTLDPIFHTNPDLPDVDNRLIASSQIACGLVEEVYTIPFGAQTVEVCVPDTGDFPSIEGMPAALRVEQPPMSGPPQVVVDNEALALELLAAQQATVTCDNDMGDSGGSEGGSSGGSGGSGLTAGNDESEAGLDAASSGCGCTSGSDSGPWALALGLVVLGLVRTRGRGAA